MRASLAGRHVSGAERLVPADQVDEVVHALQERARRRERSPDSVTVQTEPVDPATIVRCPCLAVTTVDGNNSLSAWDAAAAALGEAGVSPAAVNAAHGGLMAGWHAGIPIRGAALLDKHTGARLDTDLDRGVRVSRFDYAPLVGEQIKSALAAAGLAHFRTYEALALATKTLWAGIAAELCWSDDPGYVAGYVATPLQGYLRFDPFKPEGAVGGRAFFVAGPTDIEALIQRLERAPLWIDSVPEIGRTSSANRL